MEHFFLQLVGICQQWLRVWKLYYPLFCTTRHLSCSYPINKTADNIESWLEFKQNKNMKASYTKCISNYLHALHMTYERNHCELTAASARSTFSWDGKWCCFVFARIQFRLVIHRKFSNKLLYMYMTYLNNK